MAPITSSIGAVRRSRKSTTSNRMRQSRTTRSRLCSALRRRQPHRPAAAMLVSQDEAIADMQVMLREMERHYRKRPIIDTTVDFYEANLSDGALMDYPIWVRS